MDDYVDTSEEFDMYPCDSECITDLEEVEINSEEL